MSRTDCTSPFLAVDWVEVTHVTSGPEHFLARVIPFHSALPCHSEPWGTMLKLWHHEMKWLHGTEPLPDLEEGVSWVSFKRGQILTDIWKIISFDFIEGKGRTFWLENMSWMCYQAPNIHSFWLPITNIRLPLFNWTRGFQLETVSCLPSD